MPNLGPGTEPSLAEGCRSRFALQPTLTAKRTAKRTAGTYDGRYVYVNDKANARLARVRCDIMEVDAITDIPNSQGTHGIFPQRHKTGLVLCNAEFRTPQPNDGRDLDDPKAYGAMHTAIDGETMEVKWQVLVEGNMDLCATDYEGKYSFATCYNSEGASISRA